jgi:hypothetical protein
MQLGMITEIVWREFERQQKEDWKGTPSTGSDLVPRAIKTLRVRKQSRFVDGWPARPAFLVSGAEGIRVTWCILFVTITFLFRQHLVVTHLRVLHLTASNATHCTRLDTIVTYFPNTFVLNGAKVHS